MTQHPSRRHFFPRRAACFVFFAFLLWSHAQAAGPAKKDDNTRMKPKDVVVSAAVEIIGGLLLIAGYRTRVASLALAFFTLAAGFAFHAQFSDVNQTIHFMKNLAMTGGLLQVAAFGAGAFSLDAFFAKSSSRNVGAGFAGRVIAR